jgi:O-antigen ligase
MTLPVALAVGLIGLMLLRLGASADQAYGSTKLQLYIADNVVFLVGAVFVGATRQNLRTFLIVTLAVVAAGAFLLLGELARGTAQQVYGGASGRFAINAQQGAINLGRASSNGALIAIFLIIASRRLSLRLVGIALLPILLVALVAAGSRGPTVAFMVGLLALVALTAASGRARRQLLLVAAAMVAAGVVIPVLVPGSAIGRSLSTIVGSANGLSSNGRSALWSEAFTAFSQHPLFGIGTGGFGAIDPVELYPHNLLLETGAELGVLGVLTVGVMILSMLRRLSALWRQVDGAQRLEVTVVISLFVSALVNSMFSGGIQDNADIWLWGGLGIGMYARLRITPRRAAVGLFARGTA